MKIPQRLSWGGITSITERTTQARKAGEAALCSKRPVLRTGAGSTQTARTTLRRIFEDRFASDEGVCRAHSTDEKTDIHPNGASQLCDGFSRIDQLPEKECAGRTRLMRKREERAICQQSGHFFRPRRSDHYNPPSTSILHRGRRRHRRC